MKSEKKIDCLFLHVPQIISYKPNKFEFFTNFIAMGVFSMSNEIAKAGFNPKIIHVGLNKVFDSSFNIAQYVKENDIKFIAMSLHWHYQTFSTLEVAKKIKEENPDTFILLGGYTSSIFAKDILEKCPYINAVIKGEGEKPIVRLISKFYQGSIDFSEIPNLYWRKDNDIVINKDFWIANEDDLNSYDFDGLKHLDRAETYLRVPLFFKKEENEPISLKNFSNITFCFGRGCPGNCTWCGGGFNAVKQITGRNRITIRDPKVVANEILNFKRKYNLDEVYVCYDPFPKKQNFLLEIFDILGKEMPKQINVAFECFGLPTKKFVDSFKKNLGVKSQIIISPEFGDEELRKKHKSFYYSNNELLDIVKYIYTNNIRTLIYFAELPFESILERRKTDYLVETLKNKFTNIPISVLSIDDVEPFSPWAMNPEKYGATIKLKTLDDYILNSKGDFGTFV